MVDLTMCMNKTCPLRSKCYRYRAVPSMWQSFAMYQPHTFVKNGVTGGAVFETECEYFWEIDGRVLRSVEEADNMYVPKEVQ